jgi:hypothetical protein
MPSSAMLRCRAFVRTGVSEEPSASIIRSTRIDELGRMLTVTNNRRTLLRDIMCRWLVTPNVVPGSPILATLLMEALLSSETSTLIRATRGVIPEDGIFQLRSC